MSRFDYVKYDEQSAIKQSNFKATFESLAVRIEVLGSSRASALALTALEECYMWIGKAIRDEQISRSAITAELQEERANS